MIIKRDNYLNQLIASQHNGLIKIITRLRKRMAGAVEYKLCAAAYRTDFADNKSVIIFRIMIRHVVFLEISRIIHI